MSDAVRRLLMAAGSGGSSTPPLADAITALSPVGYWKLDESSGTTATDSSGNARHGTYTGSGYTLGGATGADGNYVDLGNSASSHIAVADHDVFSVDTAPKLTVFMLVKPDSVAASGQRHYISKGSSGKYEWGVQSNYSVSGWMQGIVWTNPGSSIKKAEITSMTTAWQAVAVVLNTAVTGAIYRNSSTASGSATSAAGGTYANNTAPVWIGWRADSAADQYHQGGLAHVAIFAGELSSSDIGTLMASATGDGWI